MYSVDYNELQIGVSIGSSNRLINPGTVCTSSIAAASVNSSDGRLQLQALRVFDGPCQLSLGPEKDGLTSIWVRGSSTAALFRVKGLKNSFPLDDSYELFIVSCQKLGSSPAHFNENSSRGYDTFLLALMTRLQHDDKFFKLQSCCIAHYIHLYSMDRVQSRLEGDNYFSNALHSVHWILHTLQNVSMSDYTAESDHDWIYPCIFPSLQSTTREILHLMLLLTEPRSPEDVPVALAQALSEVAKNICQDFDPLILDERFYLTVKDHEMLSLLSSIWEPRRQGRKTNRPLIMEVDYARPSGLSGNRRQSAWTRLSQYDYEWQLLWNTTTFPVKFRFSVWDIRSRMEQTTPYTAMRYAREYCKSQNQDLEGFVHRSPGPDDHYVFAEGWGPRLVQELNLAWRFEDITIA